MIKRKILNYLKGNNKRDDISHLIKRSNITIGKNSKIQNLSIYISEPIAGVNYITIGDNCMISGQIIINGKNAKINIGNDVFIGENTKLFCRESISLKNNIMISWGCTIIDTNAHSLHSVERLNDVKDWIKGDSHKNWDVVKSLPIVIKDSCWIGFNSIITKGITLETGSVIGCGSVVTKSTQPFGVYGGNPAIHLKTTD